MNEQKIINDAIRYVLDLLDPINHYPYHNINHTLDVYSRVGHLVDREWVGGKDRTDLLIAALFHDTGFTVQYSANETIGAAIARKYLESIWYEELRIQQVERLILCTVLFSPVTNILDKIIQDADVDNFWRKDCFVKTLLVRKELNIIANIDIPKQKWLEMSYNLIRKYKFKTVTSQWERNDMQSTNIQKLYSKIS